MQAFLGIAAAHPGLHEHEPGLWANIVHTFTAPETLGLLAAGGLALWLARRAIRARARR